MQTPYIYKLLSGITIFAVFLVLNSCDSRPKPDKIIKMVIEFDSHFDSNQKIDSVILVLNTKLEKTTASYKVSNTI